jgi:hypothetical protein
MLDIFTDPFFGLTFKLFPTNAGSFSEESVKDEEPIREQDESILSMLTGCC